MIPFREVSQGVILCRRGSFIIFLPRRDEGTKNCSGSNSYRNKNPRLKIIAKFKITGKNVCLD